MRSFKDLKIWQDSFKLSKSVYAVCRSLPQSEQYVLVAQMQRATISIPTNISEGCSRSSQKDFKRFLEIALGSAFEVENLILLTTELYPDTKESTEELVPVIVTLQKQINALINKLK